MEPKRARIDRNFMHNSIEFSIHFCSLFGGSGGGPDPRSDWQGPIKSGVRPFRPRLGKPSERGAETIRKAPRNEARKRRKKQGKFARISHRFWSSESSQKEARDPLKMHAKSLPKSVEKRGRFWRDFSEIPSSKNGAQNPPESIQKRQRKLLRFFMIFHGFSTHFGEGP